MSGENGGSRQRRSHHHLRQPSDQPNSAGLEESSSLPRIHNGFVGWEIVEPRAENPSILTTSGHVRMKFVLRLVKPVSDGIHGIALFNQERQLMWGWAKYHFQLDEGVHEFHYSFPT